MWIGWESREGATCKGKGRGLCRSFYPYTQWRSLRPVENRGERNVLMRAFTEIIYDYTAQ